MLMDLATLPTHIALAGRRLMTAGIGEGPETFLYASYVVEVAIKTVATLLYAGLREGTPSQAYRLAHGLLRADGLGTWDSQIREVCGPAVGPALAPEVRPLVVWLTRRRNRPGEDSWFGEATAATTLVLRELGVEDSILTRPSSVRDLISVLVQIRNKTKAHGAVGADFFASANRAYVDVVDRLVATAPFLDWSWFYMIADPRGGVTTTRLLGLAPAHVDGPVVPPNLDSGIYVQPLALGGRLLFCGDLLWANRECCVFMFPNGGVTEAGQAEFIDYSTGNTTRRDVSAFLNPPVALPTSETHGADALDIQANVFGNLPSVPQGYVERPALQQQLEERLLDHNHPIITLHGRGGIGKTSLALFIAHRLAQAAAPRFECIVWFSARDVDLRPSGPAPVRPAVVSLEAIAAAYARLFSDNASLEGFAGVLQRAPRPFEKGILFIFDNFETFADLVQLHSFLDTHTHLPSKILITSRERGFKADFPIEVRGMEPQEAHQLLRSLGQELGIEGMLSSDTIDNIYKFTEGHAYIMRVVAGEIAKEGRYVAPQYVVSRRTDIVDAVFERSFSKLSGPGRWVFLVVGNWRAVIGELPLLVVLGQRCAVEEGLEECTRLSLIEKRLFPDGQPGYFAPQLARVFAAKKLDGDPDRLVLQEHLATLREFGVAPPQAHQHENQESSVIRFVRWAFESAGKGPLNVAKADGLLETLASLWPPGWLYLARLR